MEIKQFLRSRYADRMRLCAADLENQQTYDNGKRALLNRMLCGCGVLEGLEVRWDGAEGLRVLPGAALDNAGRELVLGREQRLTLSKLLVDHPADPGFWWLCASYTEHLLGEGAVLCPDGTHTTAPNRVEEGVVLGMYPAPAPDCVRLAKIELGIGPGGQLRILEVLPDPQRPQGLVQGETSRHACGRLHLPAVAGKVSYSQEITHGLGTGRVLVELAIENRAGGRACELTGHSELFGEGVRLGVQLFPESGTFIGAARVPVDWNRDDITLRWYATCFQEVRREEPVPSSPVPEPPPGRAVGLDPAVAILKPGEQVTFIPRDEWGRLIQRRMRFAVVGGHIDQEGHYIAPEQEGFFQIRAIFENPEEEPLTAIAMVRREV